MVNSLFQDEALGGLVDAETVLPVSDEVIESPFLGQEAPSSISQWLRGLVLPKTPNIVVCAPGEHQTPLLSA